MKETKKTNIYALCQCGIFIALATILSFLPVYEMPMGGSVTLASMLPILLIGVKFGYKWGLGTSCVYMAIQLIQAFIKGNVFVYCVSDDIGKSILIVTLCALFDYVVPFGILGLSAFAKPKEGKKIHIGKVCATFSVLIFIRFLCHFITGIVQNVTTASVAMHNICTFFAFTLRNNCRTGAVTEENTASTVCPIHDIR